MFLTGEDGKRLYIHILSYPATSLDMEGLEDKIDYAQFLHDASEVRYAIRTPHQTDEEGPATELLTIFQLPAVKPDVTVPVIEIFLK